MVRPRRRRERTLLDHLALAGLAALIVCCWLLTLDQRSGLAGADESHYLIYSAKFCQRLNQGEGLTALALDAGIDRGPLFFALSGAVVRLGQGGSIARMRGLSLPAWAALLWVVYFLARPLVGRAWALLAAALSGLAPAAWEIGGYFNYHVFEALLYSATLALLLRSRGLSRRWYSLAAGICAGLLLLSAHAFPLPMLLPPLALCAVWGARTKGVGRAALGMLLFALPAALLASRYLLFYYAQYSATAAGYLAGGAGEVPRTLWAYWRALFVRMLAPGLGPLSLLLLPLALLAGRRDWSVWTLALASLPPLLWMGLFGPLEQVFNPAYLFPILAPLIVLLAFGAAALPSATARRALFAGMLAAATAGWCWNVLAGPARADPLGYHSAAPGYGEPCERLNQRLSGLEGRTAVYFVSYELRAEHRLLDLYACADLARPGLNALMTEHLDAAWRTDAPAEVWLADRQRDPEPGRWYFADQARKETLVQISDPAGFARLRPAIEIERYALDDAGQAALLADPGLVDE